MNSQNPVWTPQPQGFFSQETSFADSAHQKDASVHDTIKLNENEQQAINQLEHQMRKLVNIMESTKKTFLQLEDMVETLNSETGKGGMRKTHLKQGLSGIKMTVVSHMGKEVPELLALYNTMNNNIFKILRPMTEGLLPIAIESLTTTENAIFGSQMTSLTSESSQQTAHLTAMRHLKIKMHTENDNLLRKMVDASSEFKRLEETHNKQLGTIRAQQQNTAKMYKNIANNFMGLFEGHKRVWDEHVSNLESLMVSQEKLDQEGLTKMVANHLSKLNSLSIAGTGK
jgi:hypothetical protein